MTTAPEVSPDALTDAQRAFAHAHRATPGFRSEISDAVFVYHRGSRSTTRWLIDATGLVVESTSLVDGGAQ